MAETFGYNNRKNSGTLHGTTPPDTSSDALTRRLGENQAAKDVYVSPKAQGIRDTIGAIQNTPAARKVVERLARQEKMKAFLKRNDTI